MAYKKNFRHLIETAQRRGRKPHEASIPMREIAKACGLSRASLYNLMNGTHSATPPTIVRITKGLRVPIATVKNALARTQAEAML